MTRGRCTCISMLEFNTRGSCTSDVKLNVINYSCFDSGPLIQSICIPPVCVHLVSCPIPLLEAEGSAWPCPFAGGGGVCQTLSSPVKGQGTKLLCIVYTDLTQPVSSCLLN